MRRGTRGLRVPPATDDTPTGPESERDESHGTPEP